MGFALCCWVAATAQSAPLTEAEKKLLQGSISVAQATEFGEQADAAGLAKIIKLEDPALVQAFNAGMTRVGTSALPADLEALVIANFEHPTLGRALRAFSPKYRTRRLFDLHYARIKAGDVRNSSQIGNTDLAGIEEPLLQLLDRFERKPNEPNWLVLWLGHRKYPGAVPLLLESLRKSYLPTAARHPALLPAELQLLISYPSVEVWRQARAVLEDLHRSGVITDVTLEEDSKALDNRIRNPEQALAQFRQGGRINEYRAKQNALRPTLDQIGKLRETDPSGYLSEYRAHLEKLELLLAEYADSVDGYAVATQYFDLAMLARFGLRRPAEAADLYAGSARHGHALGHVAAADTYQFDLRDKIKAAQAYQRALDASQKPFVPTVFNPYRPDPARVNEWLMEWLPREIRYLRSGERYRRGVGGAPIEGFFTAVQTYGVAVRSGLTQGLPGLAFRRGPAPLGQPGFSQQSGGFDRTADTEKLLARIDRESLGQKLDQLPASHLTLLATVEHVSVLSDAGRILRYLEKHDPSGYWSACLLASVYAVDLKSAQGSDEARNELAQAMPGLIAPSAGGPRAISVAAEQVMKGRVPRAK